MSSISSSHPHKYLAVDSLIQGLRERFEAIEDSRRSASVGHSLADCLMSAFAMFSLKEPSLLAFDQRRQDKSLMNLYKIKSIPSDTQHRTILDNVDPQSLNECFADVFFEVQRAGMLKEYVFHDGHYLLAIDATGHFCSTNISCPHCLVKNSKSGKVEYSHQMVAAILVHPDLKTILPIAVEPLKMIVIEDGLASNGPHMKDLIALNFAFILGAKPNDHKYLFDNFAKQDEIGLVETISTEASGKTLATHTQWLDHLQINASHPELEVSFIQQMEVTSDQEIAKRFSWITQLKLDASNVAKLAVGARARWKIENETFNTLKNQGYHLDYNFGHGQKHLSTVFATLMFLAFLVDQVQQLSCPLFAKATKAFNTKKAYWHHIRCCFEILSLTTWQGLYEAIIEGKTRNTHIV